jgi:hypothetical protein
VSGHVARMGKMANIYKILVGKPKGKTPRGRHRHMREDNIKMDVRETGWKCVDWIYLSQDSDHWRTLVNTVLKLQVPERTGYFLTS